MTLSPPANKPNGTVVPTRTEIGVPPSAPPVPAPGAPADDDLVTLAVRYEPIGPTTPIKVSRSTRMEEVKDEALRRFAVPPATAQKCVIALEGRLIDEAKKVGDFGFSELAFLSVGLLDDVYIEDRDWRTGGR